MNRSNYHRAILAAGFFAALMGGSNALAQGPNLKATRVECFVVNPPTSPPVFLGFTATRTIGLRWIDNASNESNYVIRWSKTENLRGSAWSDLMVLNANTQSCQVDISVTAATSLLSFQVQAICNGSAYTSSTCSVNPSIAFAQGFAFPAPTNAAIVYSSPTTGRLTWSDNHANEPSDIAYSIERKIGAGSFQALTPTLLPNRNQLELSGLDPCVVTRFRVRSIPIGAAATSGRYLASAFSNIADFGVAPAAPSGLMVRSTTTTQVNLQWADNSSNESKFRIQRSANGCATFVTVAEPTSDSLDRGVVPEQVLFSDTGLTPGASYCYRIQASNCIGASAFSETVTAVTVPESLPIAPSELTASAVSPTSIQLRWRDNSNNETQFAIYRSVGNSALAQLAAPQSASLIRDLDQAFVTYVDSSAAANTSYCYAIFARNSAGDSYASNSACVITPLPQSAIARFTNNTAYPLVSLLVNGAQCLPGSNVLNKGASLDVAVPGGAFTWAAKNGGISNGQKWGMYRFPNDAQEVLMNNGNAPPGQTVAVAVNNHPIGQILTRLRNAPRTYWYQSCVPGPYGQICNIVQLDFQTSGSYVYRSTEFGQLDTGTASIISYPGDGTIRVRMNGVNHPNGEATFYEVPDGNGLCWINFAGANFSDQ